MNLLKHLSDTMTFVIRGVFSWNADRNENISANGNTEWKNYSKKF